MARWVVAPSSLLLLALLLLPLAEGSDVWGALQSRDNPSHSAVALIFAFGLAVIVVIVSIVVLTLCCCDRPPKRQYYVTSSGSGGGPVGAPAAVVAATPPASTGPAGGPRYCTLPVYHGGMVPRTVARFPRVHSPYLVHALNFRRPDSIVLEERSEEVIGQSKEE